jgi:hypothetical protein
MRPITIARIGALFYIIWGVLHFSAAYEVYKLGALQSPTMVQGRLYQDAWNLAFFAAVAIVAAVWLNWRNIKTGYWINLLTVSVTDIGFVLFVLLPGHLPWIPGIIGPAFWIPGVIFTTWAYLLNKTPTDVVGHKSVIEKKDLGAS